MCCFIRPHCHGGFMMPNMFYHTPMYMMPHHHCGPKNFGQGFAGRRPGKAWIYIIGGIPPIPPIPGAGGKLGFTS